MERPALQHPLPEEIQKMKRDETVCKFCGVSYLIHNEIKALEDKLRAAEEELSFYRGIEEREEKLKQKIEEIEQEISRLQQESLAKEAVLGTLKNDVRSKEKELERIHQLKLDVDNQLNEVRKTCEQYRLKNILYRNKLPSIIKQIQEQKNDSLSIRNLVAAQNTVLREECRLLQDKVIDAIKEQSADISRLQIHVSELERSVQNHTEKEDELQTQLEDAQQQIKQLSTAALHSKELQVEVDQLNHKVQDLQNKLDEVTSKNRMLIMENNESNDQKKKYIQDLEVLNARNKQKAQELQECTAKCSRLQDELNERDNQIKLLRREQEKMQQEFEETQAKLQQTASVSTSQTENLKEALAKLSGDMEALKKEREMMITAHQNQIEQLRVSFRSRIAEADKWPQKMEEAIKKEREKHVVAMTELENRLKENFIMEMQIEKQKHQELLQKYQDKGKLDENQVKKQMDNIHNQYKAEISELHKQLAEYKAQARATENSLRDEISSLKDIISDLTARLARIDTAAESKVQELQHQLHACTSEINELKMENKNLTEECNSAKEEIAFLQETVRKECEERFELTEALSQAKEQLLAFKRPAGGYHVQQAWAGASRGSSASSTPKPESRLKPASSTTSLNSSRSEEIAIFKKLAKNRPQPPSLPRESVDDREQVNLSTLAFTGQQSNRSVSKGLKGATLNESRRRIGQILGRR